MNKKSKKIVVNSLTLSRVIVTLLMPILFNFLSGPAFLLLIGGVLLTDALDGFLARHWEVSTLFGSWFDMGADKLLGGAILLVLSFTYPIMLIPFVMEMIISDINLKSTLRGGLGKSSWIGKGKMWIMGLSICSLLLIGASPEISTSLSNIKVDTNFFKEISIKIKEALNFIQNNKETIKNIAIPSTIIAETVTTADYLKKYEKVKENEPKFTKEDYIKYKEYIKSIMFDEKYYEETKNMELYKKLIPEEYLKEKEKTKKLTLK